MNQQIARDGRQKRRSGQALVEYVMAILLCIGVSTIIDNAMKRGIVKLWTSLAKDIAPGCPGCDPPTELSQ